jgi:hypothetical protein
MRGKMYMGVRGNEQWVPACQISPDFTRAGWNQSSSNLQGGLRVNSSKSGSKGYAMTWGNKPRADMRIISDMKEGHYDTKDGVNLIYFLDPMAMEHNLAPQMWSAFALAAEDGMPLFRGQRPRAVPTPPNDFGYPARSAVYRCTGETAKLYVPIPKGYVAWVGAHGASDGAAGIRVTPQRGLQELGYVQLNLLDVSTDQLVNHEFKGYTGIELSMIETAGQANLSPNPSAEGDLSSTRAIDVGTAGGALSLQRNPTGRQGSYSFLGVVSAASTTAGMGIEQDVPVVPGRTYSYGAWVRTSRATRVRTYLRFYTAAGEPVGGTVLGAEAPTAANPVWTSTARFTNTRATAPAGAAFARISFGTAAGEGYSDMPVGAWINVDGIQFNEGNSVQAYADGETAGWEWTNGKHISPSRKRPDLITLSGLVIQVLPEGSAPRKGRYISGQGNAGCQFVGDVQVSPMNDRLDMVGVTAKLGETGPWL